MLAKSCLNKTVMLNGSRCHLMFRAEAVERCTRKLWPEPYCNSTRAPAGDRLLGECIHGSFIGSRVECQLASQLLSRSLDHYRNCIHGDFSFRLAADLRKAGALHCLDPKRLKGTESLNEDPYS